MALRKIARTLAYSLIPVAGLVLGAPAIASADDGPVQLVEVAGIQAGPDGAPSFLCAFNLEGNIQTCRLPAGIGPIEVPVQKVEVAGVQAAADGTPMLVCVFSLSTTAAQVCRIGNG